MLRKQWAAATLLLVWLGFAPLVSAQQTSDDNDNRTFGQRVQDFGRSIFGIIPGMDDKPASNDPRIPAPNPNAYPTPTASTSSQPPVLPSPPTDSQTSGQQGQLVPWSQPEYQPPKTNRGYVPQTAPPGVEPTPLGARPINRWNAPTAPSPDEGAPGFSAAESPAASASPPPAAPPAAVPNDPTALPLHERMSMFQHSPFADVPATGDKPRATTPLRPTPATVAEPTPAPVAVPTPAAVAPTPAVDSAPTVPIITPPSSPEPRPLPVIERPAATPQFPTRAKLGDDTAVSAPASPAPAATRPTPIRSSANAGSSVLSARKTPNLSVETVGPRKIAVGKEAAYEVAISNSGDVPAEELVVLVEVPMFAEVSGGDASQGTVQTAAPAAGVRRVQWKVGRLEANARERLALRIIPRESRTLDLAVHFDYKQFTSQTAIEVQEPKLALRLEGPREMAYGRRETYKLRVSNTGSGDAENVLAKLQPVGVAESPTVSHHFGTIAAGEEKAIEVELVARQSGSLVLKAEAACDGGNRADAAEPVLIRRAALAADVNGPKLQFVDAATTYRVRVKNSGNAPARQLTVTASLPPGAKFISGSEGAQAVAGGQVRWRLEPLAAGGEKGLELKCALGQQGTSRLDIACTADDDLAVQVAAATRVEAVAELVMEVIDPPGPVAISEDAVYELRLLNRGTKSAEEIDVAAFFSQGVEPISAEGAIHRMGPGQVTFSTIPVIGPGKELRLKIAARAQTPGNHIFRAEVHCRPLATRLVREETTRFYAPDGAGGTMVATPPDAAGTRR